MIYIKFDIEIKSRQETNLNKFIKKILNFVFPLSNPDFENEIKFVKTWYLEFLDDVTIPTREIGIDSNGNTIMLMPFKNNYGYWVDNNLKINDFKGHFNVKNITKEEFDSRWNNYIVN